MATEGKLWPALGAVGALMAVLAQTPPEQAVSNMTAWARFVGLDQVSLPQSVDTAVSIVGILMALAALVHWWLKRQRRRRALPGFYLLGDGVEHMIAERVPSRLKPIFSFIGDIERAKAGNAQFKMERNKHRKAEWEPDEQQIREECAERGNPRVEPYLSEARDELLKDHHFLKLTIDEVSDERKREMISKGRDLVHRYRELEMPEPFGRFADRNRGFIDIRPHLSDEYWRGYIGRYELEDTQHKRDYDSAMFERELAKLEEIWFTEVDHEKQERRRQAITECRKMIAEFDETSGWELRDYLQSHECFITIRRHLGDEFEKVYSTWSRGHVSACLGVKLPPAPIMVLERRLYELEKEWGLGLA